MPDTPYPIEIRRISPSEIEIVWSDELIQRFTAGKIRKACPCATCREKQRADQDSKDSKSLKKLPVLGLAEARPLSITAMQPVGNYAYNIAFSDGHDSGIFQFAYLRQLGT